MADYTITTDTNLDSFSTPASPTTVDNFLIKSAATLTVNSDNIYGQYAHVPTMQVYTGNLLVDGRDVWLVPFDASSGNVPALGTVNTDDVQVSSTDVGEFLAIYSALGTTPLTAGTALPSSGYVKLRKKTGTIADNDVLTFTNNSATVTVNSATGGQRGWIEYSQVTLTANGAGSGQINILGDWFELGVSDGTAGQTFQYFQNYEIGAVQVETGSGTGVYEWWGDVRNSTRFSDTTIFDTSDRAKVFYCSDTGLITFGGNTYGKLPPNGARIRVPNVVVIRRDRTTGYPYTTTRTNAAGYNNFSSYSELTANKVSFVRPSFIGGYSGSGITTISNSSFSDNLILKTFDEVTLTDVCWACVWVERNGTGSPPPLASSAQHNDPILMQSIKTINIDGFYVRDTTNTGFSPAFFSIKNSTNGTLNDLDLYFCSSLQGGTVSNWVELNGSNNIAVSNSKIGHNLATTNNIRALAKVKIISSEEISFTNTLLRSNLSVNATKSSTGGGFELSNSENVVIDNLTLYPGRVGDLIYFGNNSVSKNISVRNIGTKASPLNNLNTTSFATNTVYRITDGNVNSSYINNVSLANIFISDTITGTATNNFNIFNNTGSEPRSYVNEVGNNTGLSFYTFTPNQVLRRITRLPPQGNQAWGQLAKGIPFFEVVESSTSTDVLSAPDTISICFGFGNVPDTSDIYYQKINRIRTNNGSVFETVPFTGMFFTNVGDYLICEPDYDFKGITGLVTLTKTAPTTPSQSMSVFNASYVKFYYDIDRGQGYTGTFTEATNANLQAETNLPADGLRIRLKAECVLAPSANMKDTNYISYMALECTTTTTAFNNNSYGSNITVYRVNNLTTNATAGFLRNTSEELAYVNNFNAPTVYLYPDFYSNESVTLRVRSAGYTTLQSALTANEFGFDIPVQQEANGLPTTDPGALGITVTNHGASPVTWEGKTWSISIVVTDSSSPAQIANFLNYNLAQDSRSIDSSYHNIQVPDMVIPVGNLYETARGRWFGSAGATLKGVRVVDGSGNEIPGFSRMQADDGTFYSPAASYTLTVDNIVSGSRLLLRRTDTQATISNVVVTSGTFTYTYTHTSDIPVEIVVRKATTTPFYQEWSTTTTLSNSNNTQTANQLSDE